MLKQWRYFLLALGFFTRIPTPHYANFQESDLNHAAKYFPLIGMVVGSVGAISFYLAHLILPQIVAVLISMCSTIYLTGAFHEDGLADSADGLGGGYTREQILTIMQDSRLGTYGAVALFLMLFAKLQILSLLSPVVIPAILIAGHTLSRLSAVWLMANLTYTKPAGKAKPLATAITGLDLWFANVVGFMPLVFIIVMLIIANHPSMIIFKFLLMTLLPVVASWFWWREKLKTNLGGYTGDTLGAVQQITEITFYLGVLVWVGNGL